MKHLKLPDLHDLAVYTALALLLLIMLGLFVNLSLQPPVAVAVA